jgi:nitroimidazol reductase NimA-like FMN-containing flavoprotein (pyridoxamine 5'-phosphate oxidase superfamily)
MKLHLMRENPEVCFEVDWFDGSANWESVIANAHFEELHGAQADTGWQLLVDRLESSVSSPPGATVHPTSASEPGVVYRLRLHDKTGRFEKRV